MFKQIKDLGTEKLTPEDTDLIPIQETSGATRRIKRSNFLSGISSGSSISYASLADLKPSATPGGSYTANTQITRTLNTVVSSATWLLLSSNAFTLQAGTYIINAKSPAIKCGAFKAWLQNASGIILLLGSSEYSNPGAAYVQCSSEINGSIVITSPQTYTIKFQADASSGVNYGLGIPNSISGQSEVYTQVSITKIA